MPYRPRLQVRIRTGLWEKRQRLNAEKSLWHQWEQLERTGCIENFRLVAGGKEGFA
ncbi:MAG: hypothetical protein Fur0043_28440 [Anaerolineales bacterium]